MKLLHRKEPVRLKKPTKKQKRLTKNDIKAIQLILLIILLFLIFFVLIPLLIYNSGSLESTNYYYRLPKIV